MQHQSSSFSAEICLNINHIKMQNQILYAYCWKPSVQKKLRSPTSILCFNVFLINETCSQLKSWMAGTDMHMQFTTYRQLVTATRNQMKPLTAEDLSMMLYCRWLLQCWSSRQHHQPLLHAPICPVPCMHSSDVMSSNDIFINSQNKSPHQLLARYLMYLNDVFQAYIWFNNRFLY